MFWNWLFQTCAFLKEIHGMCKHHQMVVFHILLRNVYNLFEQWKIFFARSPINMSPIHLFFQFPFSIILPMF